MKPCLLLAVFSSLAIPSGSAPAATPRASDCAGVGTPTVFFCNDWCNEGCTSHYAVTTTGGDKGYACVCDIVGPHPNCCRLALIPSTGGFDTSGDCNAAGCNTSGWCTILSVADGSVTVAECLPQ